MDPAVGVLLLLLQALLSLALKAPRDPGETAEQTLRWGFDQRNQLVWLQLPIGDWRKASRRA